jgi:RNA polymerase sigma factor (sigma-70 family)
MSRPRAEDHLGLVRGVAWKLAQRMPTADLDELVGDGNEALLRLVDEWTGEGSFAGFAMQRLRYRMIDGHRQRTHCRTRVRMRPLESTAAEHWPEDGLARFPAGRSERTDVPAAPSAEDEALAPLLVAEALATLPPRLRLVADASLEPGGQRRLAADLGVTEGRVSQMRAEAHRRLRRHFERAEAA